MPPKKLHKFLGKVELKECSKCKIWMKLDQFGKRKSRWDNLQSKCKSCNRLYNEKNNKIYYKKNKDKVKKYKAEYGRKNREKIKNTRKKDYEKNKEKRKNSTKKWKKENREKVNEWNKKNCRKRYHSDPIFRLKSLARAGLYKALKRKGIRKTKATIKYLKCTWETLHHHIESQFKQGMTWENQGSKWHVDHRIPLAAFKTEKGVSICSWYRNMQPLWKEENLAKKDKYREEDKLLLVKSYITEFPDETIEDVWTL